MDDEKTLLELQKAVANCKTVRRPFPNRIDTKDVESDLKKLIPFFDLITETTYSSISAQRKIDAVQIIVSLQRLLFNRSLWQITAKSLAEQMVNCADIIAHSSEERGFIAYTATLLADHLESQRIVLDSKDMLGNYLKQIQELDSNLFNAMNDAIDEDQKRNLDERLEDDLERSNHLFSNTPMHIVDDSESDYFVDYLDMFADDFIDEIAQKRNPAKLLIAYSFFDSHFNLAAEIFRYATKECLYDEADPFYMQFEPLMQEAYRFKLEGVINFSKVFHAFLKYCLNLQAITAKEYRETLKEGNYNILLGILRHSYDPSKILNINFEKLENDIFSNPNHTINAKSARKYLNELNWRHDSGDISDLHILTSPSVKLVVSKKLDKHQLELEMKNAQQEIENLTVEYMGLDALDEYELYTEFILKIHKNMVKKYNRRMRRWTKESLVDCLAHMIQEQPELYKYPSLIRFLEAYINQLDHDNMISSIFNLQKALEIFADGYLVWGINYLSEK